jgi:hypothetical protein
MNILLVTPVMSKDPEVIDKLPVIDWLALNWFDPVIANDPVFVAANANGENDAEFDVPAYPGVSNATNLDTL